MSSCLGSAWCRARRGHHACWSSRRTGAPGWHLPQPGRNPARASRFSHRCSQTPPKPTTGHVEALGWGHLSTAKTWRQLSARLTTDAQVTQAIFSKMKPSERSASAQLHRKLAAVLQKHVDQGFKYASSPLPYAPFSRPQARMLHRTNLPCSSRLAPDAPLPVSRIALGAHAQATSSTLPSTKRARKRDFCARVLYCALVCLGDHKCTGWGF